MIDRTENDTTTGSTDTRTLLACVPEFGSGQQGRKAVFSFDSDRRTYRLESYRRAEYSMRSWSTRNLTFEQRDVDVLDSSPATSTRRPTGWWTSSCSSAMDDD